MVSRVVLRHTKIESTFGVQRFRRDLSGEAAGFSDGRRSVRWLDAWGDTLSFC